MRKVLTHMGKALSKKMLFLLLVSAGGLQQAAFSQDLASSRIVQGGKEPGEKTRRNKTLITVLSELSSRYNVKFDYEKEMLEGKTVRMPSSLNSNSNLEKTLAELLEPLELRFEKFSENNYLIYSEKSSRNINKIEKKPIPATSNEDWKAAFPSLEKLTSGGPLTAIQAAELTIRGKVTDDSGEGLPGVNVVLKGTTTGTTTQADGTYSLTVPDGNGVLVFSFIGFGSEEVAINNRSSVDISLVPDIKSLTEVVVVGYGTQKKADVTGATATITAKDFNTGVINNPLQAVQGKVAGLNISSSNSDPTNNRPVIRLRGIGSLTANSEPLIVIDGVLGAPLNSVAPEDIEKYDILKDASAAAIYGARGANGVIIITTKRGKAGRTTIDYNTYVGFDSPYKLPNVLSPDEYYNKYNELNPGSPSTSTVRTDWFKEITRTAVSMNHSLGISGGSESFNYRGSLSYLKQPGIALNSGQDRMNARLNLTQKGINDRLEVQLNLSGNLYNRKPIDYGAFNRAAFYSPLEPVYNEDGTYNAPNVPFNFQNPVAMLQQETRNGRDKQLLGNIKLSFELLKDLKAGVNASYSVFNSTYGRFLPKAYYNRNGVSNTNTSFGERSANVVNDRLLEYTLAYNKTFGQHSFGALVGYTYQYLTNEGFYQSAADFPDQFSYNNLDAANQALTNDNIGSYKGESKLDGVLARVNYTFHERYLLTANFRRDGSSRFGANNRYGYFPSLSAGWRLSEENFMKELTFLSDLKIRVGYGVTGNQNGINDYASQLLFGPPPANGKYASPTRDPLNPVVYRTAYFYTQNANPDLKWEASAMTNLGIDFGLFDNRLTGALELYNKNTRDLLFTYAVNPGESYGDGLTYITNSFLANIGTMNNKGIELSLDFLAIDKNDFQWRTNLNAARNVNKVVRLSGEGLTFPEEGIRYGTIYAGTNGYGPYAVLREGLPVGTFWGPKEVGLNDKGEPVYQVIDNATGAVSTTSNHGAATRQNLGNPQPTITLGWTNNLSYKNVDLSIFIRSSLGQKVYNASNMIYNNGSTFRAGDVRPLNVYKTAFEGDNARLTRPGEVSSRYVEDASFVRLDNANIGYTIPLKASWIRSLRVYAAGQNLLLLTKYKGLDPEVRGGATTDTYGGVNASDNLAFGLDDFFFYPRSRTFTIGLSAGF